MQTLIELAHFKFYLDKIHIFFILELHGNMLSKILVFKYY